MIYIQVGENMEINYADYVDKLLSEKKVGLISASSINLFEVFKVNHLSFEKIVAFYKMNKGYAKEHGESACGEIKKILMLNGHIGAIDEISDSHIATYMNRVRKELGLSKKKTKPVASVTPTAKTPATAVSTVAPPLVESVQVEGVLDLAEFLDVSWLDEEPEDWSIYFKGNKRPTEWNREFENLWRWILKKAPRYGMSTFEAGNYSGYGKHWAECADLFYDLNKFRKNIGLNPKGLGKQ